MIFRGVIAGGLVAFLTITTTANAQNWCGDNRRFNNAERAICDDTSLGQLDAVMSSEYFFVRRGLSKSNKRYLKRQQRRWRRDRDRCGYNPDCIRSVYSDRIDQLQRRVLDW